MADPIVPMDIYLTQASRELKKLTFSPFQRANGSVTLDRMKELVLDLAEKSAGDSRSVNDAILRAQGRIAELDYTAALNLTANAAEAAPAESQLELALIERWEDLMTVQNGDLRAEIYPFAEAVFTDSKKEALRAVAGEQVVALSAFVANDPAQLQRLKTAVKAVQTFAFQTENLDLANAAGPKLSMINEAIHFANPAYDRK